MIRPKLTWPQLVHIRDRMGKVGRVRMAREMGVPVGLVNWTMHKMRHDSDWDWYPIIDRVLVERTLRGDGPAFLKLNRWEEGLFALSVAEWAKHDTGEPRSVRGQAKRNRHPGVEIFLVKADTGIGELAARSGVHHDKYHRVLKAWLDEESGNYVGHLWGGVQPEPVRTSRPVPYT